MAAKRQVRKAKTYVNAQKSKLRMPARSRLARQNITKAKSKAISKFKNTKSSFTNRTNGPKNAVRSRIANARKSVAERYQSARTGVRRTSTRARRVAQVKVEKAKRAINSKGPQMSRRARVVSGKVNRGVNRARQGVTGKYHNLRSKTIASYQKTKQRFSSNSAKTFQAKTQSRFERPSLNGKYRGNRSVAWRRANVARHKAHKSLSAKAQSIRGYKQGISEKIRSLAARDGTRVKSGKQATLAKNYLSKGKGHIARLSERFYKDQRGHLFPKSINNKGESLAAKAPTSTTALTKYWPENNGFLGETTEIFLYKGQKIDRYGGGDWSRFFSPQGTPDFGRALPPGTAGQQLRTFEVMKPFPVQSGQVAPAFGQIGGGTQMVSPVNLKTLLDKGILREVTP